MQDRQQYSGCHVVESRLVQSISLNTLLNLCFQLVCQTGETFLDDDQLVVDKTLAVACHEQQHISWCDDSNLVAISQGVSSFVMLLLLLLLVVVVVVVIYQIYFALILLVLIYCDLAKPTTTTTTTKSSVQSSKTLPFHLQFAAGAIAGVSEICVMYPLDGKNSICAFHCPSLPFISC